MTDRAKDCMSCALAKWDRTATGRLHPNGSGLCQWKFPEVVLPVAYYFIGYAGNKCPSPNGGRINRDPKYLKECAAWQAKTE